MDAVRAVVVTYNNEGTIEPCLASLQSQRAKAETRLTVVDNASSDGTVEVVRRAFPSVQLLAQRTNLGFGPANNVALRQCSEPLVLLINPDARLGDGALAALLADLDGDRQVGAVGPRIEYPDGCPQVSFGPFPGLARDAAQRALVRGCQQRSPQALARVRSLLAAPFEPDWISAACMLARMEALAGVGFFDEEFFLYFEDVDLCRRLRTAGWRVRVQPAARCAHSEGHSHAESGRMKEHFRRSRLLYENKHGSRLGFLLYKLLRARDCELKYDGARRLAPSKRVKGL